MYPVSTPLAGQVDRHYIIKLPTWQDSTRKNNSFDQWSAVKKTGLNFTIW